MLDCERRDNTMVHHVGGATRISHPDYVVSSQYPPGLDKAKNRAIYRGGSRNVKGGGQSCI